MEKQRDWWAEVGKSEELHCLYSNQRIDVDAFHLDHFLPWRFVAHDRIWNLVPSAPGINMSKGASIPDGSLIDRLAERHFRAIRIASGNPKLSRMSGKDLLEEYVDDLDISGLDLFNEEKFKKAYISTMQPLHTLARKRFPDWIQV